MPANDCLKKGTPRAQGRLALTASIAGMFLFAVVVAVVTLALRERLRAQIVARDASVLSSVAQLEIARARTLNANYATYLGLEKTDEDSLLAALLNVSKLEGVVALRVFDANGNFVDAAPTNFVRGSVSDADMQTLRTVKPVSRYHETAHLGDFLYVQPGKATDEEKSVPLLEVLVPIYEHDAGRLTGIGQFLLDGAPTATAFDNLDRDLVFQDVTAMLAAFILGGGLVSWSYWKLHRSNLLLSARTRELARANRELALRSRVSAIGAVTANLLHGLKNPLAALSLYVEERRRSGGIDDEGLDDAGNAVRRMGAMIEESVSILGQDAGDERFDYSLSEIDEVIIERCQRLAKEKKIQIESSGCPDAEIDNRRGNLLALAAVNLTQNAVEASPEGGSVRLVWTRDNEAILLKIEDSGPGLPENVLRDPFKPVRSGKRTGSGVGMAIAAQLIRQMDGEIRLEHSGPQGSAFSIRFTPGEGAETTVAE